MYGRLSAWTLDALGLAARHRVADVGCGSGALLPLLAERVGPTSRVVGIDRDARLLAAAGGVTDVNLEWTRSLTTVAATTYRVEIATSPFFVKPGIIFERAELVAPKLIVTELRPAPYFWRVRAEAASGQVSEWCEPQKFSVVPDDKATATGAPKSR